MYDADQQFYYVKRFTLEPTPKKTSFIGENSNSRLLSLSTQIYPRLQLLFGGKDAEKEALEIDVEEFIGVKSYKAKGKRLTTLEIKDIVELEPIRFPEITEDEPELSAENEEIEEGTSVVTEEIEPIDRKKIIEDITGQMSLF